MTTALVLAALRRRWYAVAAGLVLTAAVAANLLQSPAVFWTQTNVIFTSPAVGAPDVLFADSGASYTAMAGLVERRLNAGRRDAVNTSTEVSLVDIGMERGTRILLPNAGGQWNYHFPSPTLSVQAAGSSVEEVRALRDREVARVRDELTTIQAADGIPPEQMIGTRLSPVLAPARYANGHPRRAAGGAAVIGLALTVLATVQLDARLAPHRRGRLRRRVGRPERFFRAKPEMGERNVPA